MKHILLTIAVFFTFEAMAKKNYISGTQRVTFRSGPSVDNKVLKTLASDEAVEVLSQGDQWSKVKDNTGAEGFILNRFLTADTPYALRFNWLKSQNDKLKESFEELKTKSSEQAIELNRLSQVELDYKKLQADSSEYLTLKRKYDQALIDAEANKTKVEELSSQVSTVYIWWFLAGAGVLLFGWILGAIGRKKKGYGSSIKL